MKAKRIVSLTLTALLVLALCACGGKKATEQGSEQPAEEVIEESAEQKAFREELLAEGDGTVSVTDIAFLEPLEITGTKTLTGGTISADAAGECLIRVPEGACLILDGATLDGGGYAKAGIRVEKGGALEIRSGNIENTTRQGVRTEGKVDISGGSISTSGANWLYCAKGADVTISGGDFLLSDDVGITVFAGAKLNVSGGSFANAGNATIFNRGTADISGGSITASGNYALSNESKMNVSNFEISGSLDRGDIYNFAGGELYVEDTKLSGSANYALFNNGKAELVRVTMDATGASSINNQTQAADLTVKDSIISGAGSNGIYNKDALVTLANVSITDSENHAIYNRAGTVSADGVTLRNAKGTVVCNDEIADGENVFGSVCMKNFTVGGAKGYAISSYGGTMDLDSGVVEKSVSYCVYIKGGAAVMSNLTLQGTSEVGRAAVAVGSSKSTGANVVMTNVNISGAARGISNHGTLTFNSGTISGNTNAGELNYGGGVYNFHVFTMNGGTITGNKSTKGGGGLCNDGTAYLNGGVITGNTANTHGGGIYNTADGKLNMNGVKVDGNAAGQYSAAQVVVAKADGTVQASLVHAADAEGTTSSGGGLYNLGSAKIGSKTVISNNTAAKNGGGVYNSNTLELGATLSGNKAAENGGGIYNGSGSKRCLIDGCTVENNVSDKNGAGLYLLGEATVSGSKFIGNTAKGNGAGIYVTSNAKLTAKDSTFTGNSAEKGGGIYLYHNTNEALLQNLTMSANKANGNGTSVYSASGIVHLVGGTYSGAEGDGYTVHSYQAEGEAIPVYKVEGKLRVDSIYVTAEGTIELTGKLEAGSSLGIRLNTTKDISKRTIIVGDADIIKASVGALSIINTSNNYTYKINENGIGGSTKIGGGGGSGGGGGGGGGSSFTQYGTDTAAVFAIRRGTTVVAENLTLREAVSQAKSDDTLVLCGNTELAGNVNINKRLTLTDSGSAYTITVDTTDGGACYAAFTVSSSLTVESSSTGSLTIAGKDLGEDAENMNFTVFYAQKGASVSLKNITARDLRNYGLDGTDNKNGSLAYCYKGGTVKLEGVTVQDCGNLNANAGVIHSYQGTVNMTDCTFIGNSAKKGGGVIYNSDGKVMLSGCTFKKNSAGTYGGAVYGSGGTVNVTGCTFGTGTNANTSVNVGKDIYANGTLKLSGANTTAMTIGLGSNGTISCAQDFTMSGTDVCTVTFTPAAFSACLDGSKKIVSGGNETLNKTAFVITNDAVYFGSDGKIKSDAPFWLTVGANQYFSLQSAVNAAQSGDTIYVDGDGVIRSAVTIDKDITIAARGAARTITVAVPKALTISADVTIDGTSASLTIAGKSDEKLNGDAAIYVSKNNTLTMNSVTVDGIVNTHTSKNGAAFYALGDIVLNDVTVRNCVSENKQGAAAYVTSSGTLTLNRCTVTGNSAKGNGGAINLYSSNDGSGVLTLNGTTVTGNTADGSGDDIYGNGTINVSDTTAYKTAVDTLYLPAGKTVNAAYASQNSGTNIGIRMAKFAIGETVVTGSSAESFAEKVTLCNNDGIASGDQEIILCAEAGENVGKLIANPNLKVAKIGATKYSSVAAAVFYAQAEDTIVLTHNASVSETITIDKNLTITDDGTAHAVYLNAADTAYAFNVAADCTLNITGTNEGGLTLTRRETVTSKRPAVFAAGTVNVSGKVTVSGIENVQSASTAANCGGVFNVTSGGALTLDGTAFENCSAAKNKGAAVYVGSGASLTLDGVTMDGKSVAENGGDIYSNGSVTVDGKLSGVTVYLAGGKTIALADGFDAASQVSVTFTDNAITAISGKTVLTGSDVANKYTCFTVTKGIPGVYRFASDGTIPVGAAMILETGTIYDSLSAAISAAAAEQTVVLTSDVSIASKSTIPELDKAITLMDDGAVMRTITVNKSGGIYVTSADAVIIKGSADNETSALKITSTSSGLGSAMISVADGGSLTIENTLIDPNVSDKTRTAISASGTVTLDHVTFNKCCNKKTGSGSSSVTGAAINVTATGDVTATDCAFTNCYSEVNGGAIYVMGGGSIALTDCSFSGNSVYPGKLGADIYSNGSVSMAGKMVVNDICLASGKTIALTAALEEDSEVTVNFTDGAWGSTGPSDSILTDDASGSYVSASYEYFHIGEAHDGYQFNAAGEVEPVLQAMQMINPMSGMMPETPVQTEALPAPEALPDPAALPEEPITGNESKPTEQENVSEKNEETVEQAPEQTPEEATQEPTMTEPEVTQ